MDLFNYATSPLNPGLKILAVLLFLVGTVYFFIARKRYGGELGKVINRLCLVGVLGILSYAFRYAGDLITLWKWGESLMYLLFGLASIYAVWPLLAFARGVQQQQTQAKAAPASR